MRYKKIFENEAKALGIPGPLDDSITETPEEKPKDVPEAS